MLLDQGAEPGLHPSGNHSRVVEDCRARLPLFRCCIRGASTLGRCQHAHFLLRRLQSSSSDGAHDEVRPGAAPSPGQPCVAVAGCPRGGAPAPGADLGCNRTLHLHIWWCSSGPSHRRWAASRDGTVAITMPCRCRIAVAASAID